MDEIEVDPHTKEEARRVFAGPCDFVKGVVSLEQLPDPDMPEVAFIGRSNVGKSSLINAVVGRKALARTSNTPGRTQELNFFNLGEGLAYIVDLPGYGFAKVSKSKVRDWTKLMKNYLRGRVNLRCVFVLIDARHGLKPSDIEMMEMLDEAGVNYRIIFTKSDKQKPTILKDIKGKTEKTLKNHAAAFPFTHSTSAVEGYGIEDFRTSIYQIVSV
ncbi:MAG: YihA family ribosome biogenesis GTP-binding protein [Alphaproteobacteria bacterium]|mgnify:FL=1|nr:YihA family ribosome biogenesis GTP-binding protein [Alphaproteobacteria bacterium]|tara:strand:- start:406 stop:1050 length:645 start_codon:yes stop_codon:yes gene_type:complete